MLPICCFFLQLIDLTVLAYPHCIMIGEVLLQVAGGRVPLSRAFVEDRIFLFVMHFFFNWKSLFFFFCKKLVRISFLLNHI